VSVDTNVKGKNLSPYRTYRMGDAKILLAPQLAGKVVSIRVEAGGPFKRKLRVALSDGSDGACAID
jgi:hypothetical protein